MAINGQAPGATTLMISKGVILNSRVHVEIKPGIEHGALKQVRAVILHQTDSKDARATLNGYGKGGTGHGAHLLIDKDGTIFQAAHLTMKCNHIGLILPRCWADHTCNAADAKLYGNDPRAPKLAPPLVLKHELPRKQYPERYPTNAEAIGIEIVGKFLGGTDSFATNSYEPLTSQEQQSLDWLLKELLPAFHLTRADVYRHPQVSRKMLGEAASAKF